MPAVHDIYIRTMLAAVHPNTFDLYAKPTPAVDHLLFRQEAGMYNKYHLCSFSRWLFPGYIYSLYTAVPKICAVLYIYHALGYIAAINSCGALDATTPPLCMRRIRMQCATSSPITRQVGITICSCSSRSCTGYIYSCCTRDLAKSSVRYTWYILFAFLSNNFHHGVTTNHARGSVYHEESRHPRSLKYMLFEI